MFFFFWPFTKFGIFMTFISLILFVVLPLVRISIRKSKYEKNQEKIYGKDSENDFRMHPVSDFSSDSNVEIIDDGFTIRQMSPIEIDSVMDFYYKVIDDMQGLEDSPKWVKDVYPAREWILDNANNGTQFIGTVNGKVVASMYIDTDTLSAFQGEGWSRELAPDEYLVLHAVAVSYDCQGKNYGTRMVLYAAQQAIDRNLKGIRIDVIPSNNRAIKFYEKLGFKYVMTQKRYYEDTGLVDYLLYELMF